MKKATRNTSKKETRGLSPVIATVLLIVIVVVIALIVWFWIKGMTKEAITKFDGQNIEMVCEDVDFEASYTSPGLYITNFGMVPIFGMNVMVIGDGSHETWDLSEETISTQWPDTGLSTGGIFSDDSFSAGAAQEIVLVPVLLGESNSGRKSYVCNEKQYGYEIYTE